jgi:2-polyprenyl-6-methoxyphenol hydroxylase-like FAD-dependent oxidoreductase
MAARISKDGLWRVTYGEVPGLSREELIARQPAKFEAIFPSHPKPDSGEYRIANISPYRVHQRLAPKMRVGRVLLAADAAHRMLSYFLHRSKLPMNLTGRNQVCNPFGGLGLTGGIVDVGGLYDCLAGIYDGKADDSILDKYDEVRRQKYREVIDPISSGNIVRLFGQDPEMAGEKDEFLKMCKRTEADEEFAREMHGGTKVVMHDFTQYYSKQVNGNVEV